MPNLLEIKKRLEEIEASKNDPEAAHGLEDKLLWDFVYEVSIGRQYRVSRAAREIMKAKSINFPRWTA